MTKCSHKLLSVLLVSLSAYLAPTAPAHEGPVAAAIKRLSSHLEAYNAFYDEAKEQCFLEPITPSPSSSDRRLDSEPKMAVSVDPSKPSIRDRVVAELDEEYFSYDGIVAATGNEAHASNVSDISVGQNPAGESQDGVLLIASIVGGSEAWLEELKDQVHVSARTLGFDTVDISLIEASSWDQAKKLAVNTRSTTNQIVSNFEKLLVAAADRCQEKYCKAYRSILSASETLNQVALWIPCREVSFGPLASIASFAMDRSEYSSNPIEFRSSQSWVIHEDSHRVVSYSDRSLRERYGQHILPSAIELRFEETIRRSENSWEEIRLQATRSISIHTNSWYASSPTMIGQPATSIARFANRNLTPMQSE